MKARGRERSSPRPLGQGRHLPLLHVTAGLGAPDTSHLSVAVIPSVTVVSVGSCVKVGATSRQRSQQGHTQCAPPRDALPAGCTVRGDVYRTNHKGN